ncbi:tRNA (cytidine/uridine-2'-O-)-methyltransferase TrmJ [Polymorphobacter multimanifer]|uniref:tRNA/rRNA methyltransferase n=1 Tax=Polymorphobacter multimanifer TaxID=1070431 RepID=A0A841L6A3_9SPHN|nr:TrmH family RNA methyltransferase [Polymorphobacter multimanifer]MBB6227950.1 tRNA/rRNA methyltransferase [Polymorphobacter multimanifer]GGI84841.1 tRNA (cytidine/uridine-2'-O-)-methyltransferase TrmJ [Polymorphobacter multimanifer]
MTHRPPAVILVRPQLGVNIGAVARAMMNFGLTDLRLVNPRDGWPNADAGPAASGADAILDDARVFGSVAEACADLHLVFATAMLMRPITRRVVTPERAVAELRAVELPGGLLFGPERTGLETVDLAVAHAVCTIPTSAEHASLNLAQAVVVCAYEWMRQADTMVPEALQHYSGPAPMAELENLISDIDARLVANRYYSPAPGRPEAARLTLRNLLTRPQFSEGEVRTLRGIVRILSVPRGPAGER